MTGTESQDGFYKPCCRKIMGQSTKSADFKPKRDPVNNTDSTCHAETWSQLLELLAQREKQL